MDEQTVDGIRKTYKYKLKSTPQQEQAMAFVLRRCRELYNAGLEERQEAWRTRGVRITLAGQSVQLPDVLTCLDRAFAVFFCRVQMGERGKELGYPGC